MRSSTLIGAFLFLFLPVGVQAQSAVDRIVPACRGTTNVCRTVDFYSQQDFGARDLIQGASNYLEALKDGRITIEELAVGEIPSAMFDKEDYRDVMLSLWLDLNGFEADTNPSDWLPQGNVTVAVARDSDPKFPKVVPACESGQRDQNCMDLDLSSLGIPQLFPDGLALYKILIWRDVPNFDVWLEKNGLQGTGITPFSLMEVSGTYSFRWFK